MTAVQCSTSGVDLATNDQLVRNMELFVPGARCEIENVTGRGLSGQKAEGTDLEDMARAQLGRA